MFCKIVHAKKSNTCNLKLDVQWVQLLFRNYQTRAAVQTLYLEPLSHRGSHFPMGNPRRNRMQVQFPNDVAHSAIDLARRRK